MHTLEPVNFDVLYYYTEVVPSGGEIVLGWIYRTIYTYACTYIPTLEILMLVY